MIWEVYTGSLSPINPKPQKHIPRAPEHKRPVYQVNQMAFFAVTGTTKVLSAYTCGIMDRGGPGFIGVGFRVSDFGFRFRLGV